MTAQDTTAKYEGYVRGEVLVTPQWLEEHLRDPALRVVEVDVSPAAYDAGHIDGAVLWNVYSDLKDTSYQPAGKSAVERWPLAPGSARSRSSCCTATHRPWACGC